MIFWTFFKTSYERNNTISLVVKEIILIDPENRYNDKLNHSRQHSNHTTLSNGLE